MHMELKFVKNEKKYYDFIRVLRNDDKNQVGFLEKVNITKEQQDNYMKKFSDCYYICLFDNIPAGYVGVVDDDIRICTDNNFKKKGVGVFMLEEVKKLHPMASAKILKDNVASLKLFEKCNFKIFNEDNNLFYLKHEL